ncbi:MAG: 3D domain-containing protein [Blautia sp.]|jgi:3D (Asp-Asp-Asp) domain-containing protein
MNKRRMLAGAVLAVALMVTSTAYAAPLDYNGVVNSLKQDNKEIVLKDVKDGKKVLTQYVVQKDKVYVAVGQSVIRDLPDGAAKGMKKVTLGKWLNRVGVCENGWSVVTYRDKDKNKCIGYIETEDLSDQVQIQEITETVKAAEDTDILDYPSLKDGKILGEYIQGDTVKRTGICNEAWSQVTFRNDKGKTTKGYVPTKSLDGVKDEEETATAEAEIGAISPGSGSGIFVEASNKVTAGGTVADGVLIGDAVAVPEGAKLTPLGTFRITHYCPCSLCCGPWADGITSTGVTARTNHTIAVDPSQIPYGSQVVINGQVYTAEDCGGGITQNCIDVYVASHEEGEAKGVYYTDVYLLG